MTTTESSLYSMQCKESTEITTTAEERLCGIDASQRVLLISHCLRHSKTCQADSEPWGLQCVECSETCQVNILKNAAHRLGYKGVCIAPGGSLALKYVRDTRPRGIVAVACRRELEEGVSSVKDIADDDHLIMPPIVLVPLTRDGCVDTEVDMELAMEKISLGCQAGDGVICSGAR